MHALYSAPAPPSSHSPSEAKVHVLTHVPEPGGPGGGGLAPAVHEPASRGPQSAQSWHALHVEYSEPAPPSSQSPSEANTHVLRQVPEPGGPGGGGEGGGGLAPTVHEPASRGPQSAQSWQGPHDEYSEPRPPSSQSPSEANTHVFRQVPEPGGPGGGGEGEGGWPR